MFEVHWVYNRAAQRGEWELSVRRPGNVWVERVAWTDVGFSVGEMDMEEGTVTIEYAISVFMGGDVVARPTTIIEIHDAFASIAMWA